MVKQTVTVGNITITIDSEQTVVLTFELALAILASLTPFVALPLWLVTILPVLQEDIPLAEAVINSLIVYYEANKSHPNAMLQLKSWLDKQTEIAKQNNTPWPQEPMFGG